MQMMQEFILWSNCTNKCDFCWQYKKQDKETILNHEEMKQSIKAVSDMIDKINNGDDVLLVGGEILANYDAEVSKELKKLFTKCIGMIRNNKVRYLYINTNLLYKDISNLVFLLESISGYEERLKFTTSFDIYGRFKNNESEKIFLNNLRFIAEHYPKVNIVVNSIITKQLVETDFDFDKFKKEYGIKYINFIPYIPVKDDRSMDTDFKGIVKVLAKCEKQKPGFLKFYIDDFDLNQNKKLYEYNKYKGYVPCTAELAECHHNKNFKKVLGDECYICKLKEVFE
jgi:MoaA/NifB/PqqE/SkfB family radical SAM enzyme